MSVKEDLPSRLILGPSGKPVRSKLEKCPNDSCDAGLNRRVKSSGFGSTELYNCEKCGAEYPKGSV